MRNGDETMKDIQNLTDLLKVVYEIPDIDSKRVAVLDLIKASKARVNTKANAVARVKRMNKTSDLDKFATNYTLSGEGMKAF